MQGVVGGNRRNSVPARCYWAASALKFRTYLRSTGSLRGFCRRSSSCILSFLDTLLPSRRRSGARSGTLRGALIFAGELIIQLPGCNTLVNVKLDIVEREVDGFSVPKSLSASFINKVDATVVKHCVVASAVRKILTAFDALKFGLGERGRGSLPAAPLPTRIKGGRDSIDGVDVFPFSIRSQAAKELGFSTAEL